MLATDNTIRITKFAKHFGGTVALSDFSLSLEPGAICGLIGENGSGKSTLVKLLCGYHSPEPGASVSVAGTDRVLPLRPREISSLGFGFVHQDLALAPELSVMENVCAGALVTARLGRVRWKEQRRVAEKLLAKLGSTINPTVLAASLTQAEKAIVAIARALYARGQENLRILVLDEPTSYLSSDEVGQLFAAVREIAAKGASVLFVSHRLDEVESLCSDVAVLRDGHLVIHSDINSISREQMVEAMLGRKLGQMYPERARASGGTPVLSVVGLTGRTVTDVSFAVRAGEIVGITGLAGMGQDEIPYLLIDTAGRKAGRITLGGKTYSSLSPRKAIDIGLAVLPADRTGTSGALNGTCQAF